MERILQRIQITIISFMMCLPIFSQNSPASFHTYPIIKNSTLKKFSIPEGRSLQQFTLTNNKKWDMALNIPELKPGEKVPLVIALHWAGSGNTYQEYSSCLAFPGLESIKGIIVAPSSDGGHWIDPFNEKRVITMVKQLIKYWPVDPNKVLITGYSNGGIGSWYYTQKYPKLFTAGLPVAGSYKTANIKVPLYIIHGENDTLFPLQSIEPTIEKSIKLGSRITFKKIPEFTHFNACSYTKELQKMVTIMMNDLNWLQD